MHAMEFRSWMNERVTSERTGRTTERWIADGYGSVDDALATYERHGRIEPDEEIVARCPACADFIDYCLGHPTDSVESWVLSLHDDDDHTQCNPRGCDDARWS